MGFRLSSVSDRLWAFSKRAVNRLYYANGGVGDELMLTAVAEAARRQGRPLPVLTNLPELWSGNHDPLCVQTGVERWHYARTRGWLDTEIVHVAYRNGTLRHIAQQMADHAGLTLAGDWRPVLHLATKPPREPRTIALQNSCRGARYSASTKEWDPERWVELTRRLQPEFDLVQLGTPADPALPGVRDLRGRTSLRQAADVIAGAALFVGLESGLMHVAAAVHTPAVILYGGRSRPIETGYAFNTNLTRSPECAGCGLNEGCPHERMCMDIPVDEVEEAVRARIARKST